MFGRRNGSADQAERLQRLEVRVQSLADEVQSAVQRLEAWGAREIARQAAFEEATDKYYRTAERLRKLRRTLDGDAGDGDQSDSASLDEFYALYERLGGPARPR